MLRTVMQLQTTEKYIYIFKQDATYTHKRGKYGGRGGSCPPAIFFAPPGPSLPHPWHLDL